MAGEWIKVRTNLWNDPRIAQVCDLIEQTEATVIGAMYWLWATADEHTEDGFMPGLSCAGIDRKTGVRGFANALVTVGWLSANADGVTIERFNEHNGASAKSRAQTARRVADHKSGKNTPSNQKVTSGAPSNGAVNHGEVTHDYQKGNAATVTNALPREEKRREELTTTTPIPPSGGLIAEKKKPRAAFSLKTYLAECKAEGVKPIPEDDSVFDYAAGAGVSHEVLALHWTEFRDRYSEEGAKKYKAWRVVFGKSVRGNWFKLWYFDNSGNCMLTTAGQQAKNTAANRRAA